MARYRIITKKEEASSIYIWVMTIFLLLAMMLSLSMFKRSADTVSDNLKTSLDTANLSATTINVENWLRDVDFGIVGCTTDSPECTPEEEEIVLKRYNTFQTSLMENVGLTNNFEFSGGTCGWAGHYISSGTLKIDKFIIYEIVNNHVYSYTIEDVTSYTTDPTVTKKYCGEVGIAKTEEFKKDDNTIVSQTIEGPTILSKVEFPVNMGYLTRNLFNNFYGENEQKPIDDTVIVSKHSITSIKKNDNEFN